MSTERELFEAWFQSLTTEQRYDFDSEGRGFKKDATHMMWLAWQAARSADTSGARWQPIETAPRDGRWLLITNGFNLEQCYWDTAMHREYPWRNHGGNGWLTNWPTHWMPLPEPPPAAPGGPAGALRTNEKENTDV